MFKRKLVIKKMNKIDRCIFLLIQCKISVCLDELRKLSLLFVTLCDIISSWEKLKTIGHRNSNIVCMHCLSMVSDIALSTFLPIFNELFLDFKYNSCLFWCSCRFTKVGGTCVFFTFLNFSDLDLSQNSISSGYGYMCDF